jgi:U3 small nucleolar RNA-associated protein 7
MGIYSAHPHDSYCSDLCHAFCAAEVEEGAGRKVFDLSLTELGPYRLDFTRSGRLAVLGGRKGHLAMLDWHQLHTICELQVR